MTNLAIVVLAAGKGKRLGGQKPKVIQRLLSKPIIFYLLETLEQLVPDKLILVVGHKKEQVIKEVGRKWNITFTEQANPRGTGDAVLMTSDILQDYKGDIIVLCGDSPFISLATLNNLISVHREKDCSCTVLTFFLDDPAGYGRIKRDISGKVSFIVEELNASDSEKNINEVNAGTYIFKNEDLFSALAEVKPDRVKGEYYLTDVIKILSSAGKTVDTYSTENPEECMGINTADDFKKAEKFLLKQSPDSSLANKTSGGSEN